MIKAVLFDMDGLMFDTERMANEIWIEAAARAGWAITDADVALLRGRNRESGRAVFCAQFGSEMPYDMLCSEVEREMEKRLALYVPVRPGLRHLLDYCRARGLQMAVASSTHSAQVKRNLRTAGVDGYFKTVLGGEMARRSKPAPDLYLAAIQALGAQPGACLALEDSCNGVRSAAAAGCVTVMVPDMDLPTPEIQALTAHIVPSLLEIPAYIEQQNQEKNEEAAI